MKPTDIKEEAPFPCSFPKELFVDWAPCYHTQQGTGNLQSTTPGSHSSWLSLSSANGGAAGRSEGRGEVMQFINVFSGPGAPPVVKPPSVADTGAEGE